MKRIANIIVFLLAFFTCYGQTNTTKSASNKNSFSRKDSLEFQYMDTYVRQLREPEFELYPTTNMWNFLKLNTRTGQIWIVQFDVNGSNRGHTILNPDNLVWLEKDEICGRFKLQATQNMWNFLLLDQIEGRVWQVQWGLERKDNMIIRIY